MSSRIKAVLFDMDGVLLDTEKIWQETWHKIAQERKIILGPDFAKEICGTQGDYRNQIIKKYYNVDNAEEILNECINRVKEKMSKKISIKQGVCEILEIFYKYGLKMAVASSSPLYMIERNLKLAGIFNYFDAITSSDEVKRGKPYPDVFMLAAKKINVDPHQCYVFEDGISGIKAGVAAGCKTIMIIDMVQPTEEVKKICYKIYDNFNLAIKDKDNLLGYARTIS